MAQNRYFASLSLNVILKFVPHTAARWCNKQEQKTPRAQQYTSLLIPCAHGMLNVKHHRTTPKPETHVTSGERSCAGEKIENSAPKKRIQTAQPPPPATRQQATQLLDETCTSMSASRCCCCRSVLLLLLGQREPAPAKRGTGHQKGGASRNFRPAGTHVSFLGRVDGAHE